jgi:phosphatidylserine decarboxylase
MLPEGKETITIFAMVKFFANHFWVFLPTPWQLRISQAFSEFFRWKLSRLIIIPYCMIFSLDTDYLDQFESETGDVKYNSYDDFFKRRYRTRPEIRSEIVWPCEGYICDWGRFQDKRNSLVKGQRFDLNKIFLAEEKSTQDYYFINIFLHNHNYHHVHAPVTGKITKISSVPGDLIFLRPWFYQRTDVSYPALRNERMIFEIEDAQNKTWYMAMVGGFGVGSIELQKHIQVGTQITVGEDIAKFNLGSTVCIASPYDISVDKYLQTVVVGEKMGVNTITPKVLRRDSVRRDNVQSEITDNLEL